MAEHIQLAIYICYGGLIACFTMGMIRLLLGETLADRVVALDLIGFLTVAFIAVYTIHKKEEAFLDIAIALALVAFLGIVAFARFIYKRYEEDPNAEDR